MKILHVYRNDPKEDTRRLVEIVSEGCEVESFRLQDPDPDYDKLVDMLLNTDKAICWW